MPDKAAMTTARIHRLLHRIDMDRSMARFYSMAIEPNLFGEFSLVRNWGRIGSYGQIKCNLYQREEEAAKAMRELRDRMMQRGYVRVN